MGPADRRVNHRTRRSASAGSAFVEAAEEPGTRRMAELTQRLRLDLPDALARHREAHAHLLEGEVAALVDAEAQTQHLLLAGGERAQHPLGLAVEVAGGHPLDGRRQRLVLDEIAQLIVLFVADRA